MCLRTRKVCFKRINDSELGTSSRRAARPVGFSFRDYLGRKNAFAEKPELGRILETGEGRSSRDDTHNGRGSRNRATLGSGRFLNRTVHDGGVPRRGGWQERCRSFRKQMAGRGECPPL